MNLRHAVQRLGELTSFVPDPSIEVEQDRHSISLARLRPSHAFAAVQHPRCNSHPADQSRGLAWRKLGPDWRKSAQQGDGLDDEAVQSTGILGDPSWAWMQLGVHSERDPPRVAYAGIPSGTSISAHTLAALLYRLAPRCSDSQLNLQGL